jgi:hypothetical protein
MLRFFSLTYAVTWTCFVLPMALSGGAVRVLVEAGANLTTKDRAEHATPLGWAEYAETLPETATQGRQYTEIAVYLREKSARM